MKKTYTTLELETLLIPFRKNNEQYEITGCLLYHEGIILQYIEGHPHRITQLLYNIQKDTRHHQIIVLLQDTLSERLFPDWKMGFLNCRDTLKHSEMFENFLTAPIHDITTNTRVNIIFNMFKQLNILRYPIQINSTTLPSISNEEWNQYLKH